MKTRGFDWLTVIALAALAYVTGTALHEHLGHAASCVALGSHVEKFGAFYVDCDDTRLSAMRVRWVALAGPIVSLLTGLVCARLLRVARAPLTRLFTWMLASIGLMTAFGYMLFSAVSGIGDLGTGNDGLLHGVAMPWLWRVLMGGIGYWLYDRSVVWSMRTLAGLSLVVRTHEVATRDRRQPLGNGVVDEPAQFLQRHGGGTDRLDRPIDHLNRTGGIGAETAAVVDQSGYGGKGKKDQRSFFMFLRSLGKADHQSQKNCGGNQYSVYGHEYVLL